MTPSASQTVGPFFNFALTSDPSLGVLAGEGERIHLSIRVLDGDATPAPGDAMIELWQADSQGRYAHPNDPRGCAPGFSGFARLETNLDGTCTFSTIKPGPVADGQAPHINVAVFARGLLKQLHTRIYFSRDERNATDPVLALVPRARRETLIAFETQPGQWTIDIRLQGDGETVFFDL